MASNAIKNSTVFRKVLFWLHLTAGTVAGVIILSMSLTGLMLAFEPQIVDFAEQSLRNVSPPGGEAARLSMETILARGREAFPGPPPSGVSMRSERTSSAAVSFGREETIFINPYTGDVIGKGSKTHKVMHVIEDWHRWLGSREIGKPITGFGNAAFLILVITGVYLWWPKRWTGAALKTITRFNPRLQGKAREWNRHTVIGFWSAPIILILSLTGLIMSYQWANDFLYRLTGDAPPPIQEGAAQSGGAPAQPLSPPSNVNLLWERAEQQAPGWVAIRLRFPQRPGGPVIASIQEPDPWHPAPRSQLTLNPLTADVMKWEPFSEFTLGRRVRSWARPLHTGVAGGVAGQMAAGVGALGGVILVWTGLAMTWRRVFQRKQGSVVALGVATGPIDHESARSKPASLGN